MFAKAYPPVLALFGAAVLMADPEVREAAPPPANELPAADRAPIKAPEPREAVAPGPAGDAEGAAAPEDEKAVAEAAEAPAPFSLQEEIGRLGHEEFKVRSAAQEALLTWGRKHIDVGIEALYVVYQTTDDPEIRLRSRQVLRRLVIEKQPFDGEGYLGIQMTDHQVRTADGEWQPAVLISMVRPGTAAEAAKLKDNDLIAGVDELVFDDLKPTLKFADFIKSKGPGDQITLHVRRGEESLELTASLRRRSPLLDRLTEWGQFDLPPQEELDEGDFQDWLRSREAEQRIQARQGRAPAPAP